jgi:hypothetical protein
MERFWNKVQKTDDCWLWMGHRLARGYGMISMGGRKGRPELAHRVAYALTYGPIPEGVDVLHRCDNPPCVRPDHLFLGNQAENMADMRRKGRWRRVSPRIHRAKGYRLSEQHRAAISRGMRRSSNDGT